MAATKGSGRLIGRIRDLAMEGLPDAEIGPRVGLAAGTVGELRRKHGIKPGRPARPQMSPAEAERLRLEQAAVHASGPAVGFCAACRTWRPLAGGWVKPHPLGEYECPGSGRIPLTSHTD